MLSPEAAPRKWLGAVVFLLLFAHLLTTPGERLEGTVREGVLANTLAQPNTAAGEWALPHAP